MKVYPDASIMIAALFPEPESEKAVDLLGRSDLVASEWLVTEIASGLGIKERTKQISSQQRALVFEKARQVLATSALMLPISGADCRRAADFISRSALRAGDALHLAIVDRHGAVLWTLDRRMAEAGQALGLGTRLLV